MNILEQKNIRAPSGDEEECAKFIIDNTNLPFVFFGIAEAGEEYTLSFHARSLAAGSISVNGVEMETSTEWKRYVLTFTSSGSDVALYFGATGTYYLYHTQLEIGCKATDFTLAPEDTEDDIENLHTTMEGRTAELQVSLEGITTRVSLTESGMESANGRLTLVETQATQTEEKFHWLVASGSSASDFTLTDRTATLIAETISLNGNVKVNGDMIVDGSITASELAAGAITTDKLAANAVTAAKINVSDLFAQDITATGTIRGVNLVGATGSFSGSVNANSGTIAGWNISDDGIRKKNDNNQEICVLNGTNTNKDFLVVNEFNADGSWKSTPFFVRANGQMYASNATISGSITATSLTAYDNIKILQSGGTTPSIALNAPASTGVSSLEIGNGFGQVTIKKSLYVSSGATIVGSTSLTGGAYNAGASQFHSNGFIELSGTTPFIDFHYDYSTADYTARIIADVAGGLSIYANGGNISIGKKVIVPPAGDAGIRGNGDNVYACGHPSYRWTAVHAKNGTIQTSDEREKDILEDFAPADLSAYFMSLEPIAYRWNYGNDQRIHFGLGAQTAKRKLELAGYSADAFSLIQHDYLEEPSANGLTDRYSMDYQGYNILTMAQCQINTRDLTALKEWQLTTDIELAVITQKQDTQEARIRDLEQQLTNALIEIEQLKAALAA